MVKRGTIDQRESAPFAATGPSLEVVVARIAVHLGLMAPSSTFKPALGPH